MGYSFTSNYTTGAAATIANQLAGTPVEYMGGASTLTIYGSADAVGPDTITLTGFTGAHPGEVYIPTSPIPVASTVGAVKTNENFIAMVAIPANTRLVMAIVTTAAHTGRFLLVVS